MLHAQSTVRPATIADIDQIAILHARAFGPGRFARSAYRVRERTPEFTPYCHVAVAEGRLIAAVRFTHVCVGGQTNGLLLGPLVVDPDNLGQGLGSQLVRASIDAAREGGAGFVVLVGDMKFYGRFGFVPVAPKQIAFPGPVDPARVLALEFQDGAVDLARGEMRAMNCPL